MNERIRELIEQATVRGEEYLPGNDGHPTPTVYFDKEKFAELIVRECVGLCRQEQENYLLVGSDYCDDKAEGFEEAAELIKEHFGFKEPKGWVCPKCGVDRTKTVCPQGHTAAVEGKCPMIGVAQ